MFLSDVQLECNLQFEKYSQLPNVQKSCKISKMQDQECLNLPLFSTARHTCRHPCRRHCHCLWNESNLRSARNVLVSWCLRRGLWRIVLQLSDNPWLCNENGARGGAVGWGTAVQVGRSRVRFLKVSLEIFIDISFRPGSTQHLKEMSYQEYFVGVKAVVV